MDHKHTSRPLLACYIIHQLPGRIRVGCRAIGFLSSVSDEIKQRMENIRFIEDISVNSVTSNLLVYYSTRQASSEEIRQIVETTIASFSIIAFKEERRQKSQVTVNERRLQEEPISEMLTRVITTSATLVYVWIRGTKPLGKSFMSRFLTLPAMTAMGLSAPLFKSGIDALKSHKRPNADTLSAAAIIFSLLAKRDISALTIIWLADIAELLTAYSMDRTRKAIHEMLSVGEEFVWKVKKDGSLVKVELTSIKKDDLIAVHTGEKISVDGVVTEGMASVDQSSLTGEFFPVRKQTDQEVFAGTVVKSGNITVSARNVGDQTAIARVIHMVEEASYRKASIQGFADRFSAKFIPLNFFLAFMVYLITGSSSRALNMLIIDYSCGVRLSTATAFSAAIGTAARNGLLVKGSNYLEMLAETDTLIFDKTGTLTEGKPQVASIVPANTGISKRELLETAAAAEETSTHPMATAILQKILGSGWRIPSHGNIDVVVGKGVKTKVGDTVVRVGNRRFMEENGIDLSDIQREVSKVVNRGENLVYVANGNELMGILGINDTLRENMKKGLNRLRMNGIDDIILLTGDLEQQAEIIAGRMAMDRYEAELLPEDKAEVVLRLQSKGVRVVMIGDGINDAPALAYADVGMAMGSSRTDIAMEAADITITGDNPLMIPDAVILARKTMEIVKQNFTAAIGVNTIGLLLASVGILPVFWSAVLHNATTVAVVLNSSRLLFHKIDGVEKYD